MPDALIGHSGFVGGNVVAQRRFDALYNSRNIEAIVNGDFELLVCSGAPAAKWIANRDPEADLANLQRLMGCLEKVRARKAVLISTIDVYPRPVDVDEDTAVSVDGHHAYGKHRFLLERFFLEHFDTLIVRLPGLYGEGLKKNAIYDLLHDHEVAKIDSEGRFQFYGLDRLWGDIETALGAGLRLVNFATEPTSMREIAGAAFDRDFDNRVAAQPARYDMRTRHAAVFHGADGYLQDKSTVLSGVRRFVTRERERQAS